MITALLLLLLSGLVQGGKARSTAQTHIGEGQRLMQMERFSEAAEEFQEALAEAPHLKEARQQLAVCQFELHHYPEARQLFDQMIQLNENTPLASYYLGRIDLLEQNLAGALTHFRSPRESTPFRDELYYLGFVYFKQGKFSDALTTLTRALADNPRDYRVHQLAARTYQKLGQTDNAERAFAETQRLHDYYLQGSVEIAACRALLMNGKNDEAWERCRRLLETDDVDKLVGLGILFGKSGQNTHALEIWKRAVRLDPESSEINYNLALTAYRLKNLLEALNFAAIAVQFRPDFFEANMLYGTLLYQTSQDDKALRILTHAHELRPNDEEARNLLAHELMISSAELVKRKDLKKAVGLLEHAVALAPNAREIAEKLVQTRALLASE